ncbi:MAG: type II secretion system F family protein [Bacteriovoracaceae bacterium]
MRFKKVYTYLLFSILFLSQMTWGQSNCLKDFSQITPSCIQSSQTAFVDTPIILSPELQDQIYFYKTSNGQLGKLKVIATNVSSTECTLFFDAVTYGDTQNFIPNSSISIGVEKNHWLKDRIFLDKEGYSALELHRIKDKNVCAIVLSKGTQYSFVKKSISGIIREENNLLFYAPLVLIFIAIFIVVRGFMEEQDKFKTQEALEDAESSRAKTQLLFIKLTKPFYKRYFLPLVQGSKNKQALRNKYRQKLANAGLVKELTPEEFLALKFFMIIGGPFVFLTIRWIMEENWSLTYTPMMAIVGYFYPDIWLSGLAKKRGEEILRAMPFIVDMLALSVGAGLEFMAAIQKVIEKAPPSPLVEEFQTLIRETKIGSSRAEGLRQLSWRVNLIEINSFCATLIAADSVGASIAPILKQLSNEMRVKRSALAEQKGATAATKILVPMIFFILPAVVIAVLVPMLLKMMTGNA